MPAPSNAIAHQLETARKELLDLGLRNPLLNYRPLRTRGLQIVDEKPSEIFRLLVREGKTMSFLPVKEGKEGGDDSLLGQPGEISEEMAARHTDLRLQTPYTSAQLQTRLLATYLAARSFIEEQGVNTLFLTLGMLHWREAESSQEQRQAPLLLIPVEIERASARERFHLKSTGEDIGANLSLAAKLKAEFGIELPPLPEAEDLDVPAHFDLVEQVLESQPGWSVDREAVALGLFSFAKFLMFRDLDEAVWPEHAKPSDHPLIKSLLQDGFHEPALTITEEDHLDQRIGLLDVAQVVDADSSQVLAIWAANQGRNLVIQGPPGTGKSQTITNLIADAVGKGKKVLFVAEKMAALDVVKRRLDRVGLGDACLELHSHNTNKKAVLNELRRTLYLGKPKLRAIEGEINLLKETQSKLNAYCEAVNSAVSLSGVTPYDAYGELIKINRQCAGTKLPQFDLPEMAAWTKSDYKRRHAVVAEMQARLAAIGPLAEHPFRGSRIKILMPSEQERLKEICLAAQQATAKLRAEAKKLADMLGLAAPQTKTEAEILCRAARRVLEAPSLEGIQLRAPDWQTRCDEIRNLLEAGSRFSELHTRYDATLIAEAWDQDLLETRQHLATHGRKWWRFLSGDYRQARNRLAGLCRAEAPKGVTEKIELADAVLEARRHQATVQQSQSIGVALFGAQWQGEKSDWRALARLFEWIIVLYRDIGNGQLPAGILTFLVNNTKVEGLEAAAATTETARTAHLQRVREMAAGLDLDEDRRFGQGMKLEDQPLTEQEELFAQWAASLPHLHAIAAYNVQAETFQKEELPELLRVIESWPSASKRLVSAFEHNWYEKLIEQAFRERSALAGFQGEGHAEVTRRFCELDKLVIEHNRIRLAHAHWQRLPQQDGGGQLGVLKHEMEKKARHLPIRKLMRESGHAIQAIKPVLMMSPLSIANYLAPGSITFDLVIFDEASQVKPVDAFGAMLRGEQVVVVGDSKQMPPTSFFDSLIEGDDADEESVTGNIESILGLCVAQGMSERMLRWHYRSRHESLIATSNYEFYENRLIVFPSADAQHEELGLVFRHLPQTTYDRGKSKTNAQEASAVAQAVMDFARAQLRRPAEERRSLLVAAFSMSQMKAIQDRLEVLRRQDSSCEPFFAANQPERFDVKNLENIQGDERDVIFISLGYGRDEHGQVAMNFGPLNRDGGERRLNVLITRARMRCEVFTNLTEHDIDLSRTDSRGVQALKSFLAYARTGKLDVPVETGRGTGSPFEDEVKAALNEVGYETRTQVGSAGFFIDLAVVDSAKPGRYLLGIECDGAMYHSSRSARDRDRLRQQVLEALGWRIHRIWSTDWFRHSERELKRAVAAIEEAQTYGSAAIPVADAVTESAPVERIAVKTRTETDATEQLYQMADLTINLKDDELHEMPIEALAAWVIKVIKIESPVHVSEVVRRITTAAGLSKMGSRIKSAVEAAGDHAARAGTIRQQGEFLWLKEMAQPSVRDRRDLPSASRKIELVAPEEIACAIEQVVKGSFGIEREEIVLEVVKLLGFARTSDELRSAIEPIIEQLIKAGKLNQRGKHLVAHVTEIASDKNS